MSLADSAGYAYAIRFRARDNVLCVRRASCPSSREVRRRQVRWTACAVRCAPLQPPCCPAVQDGNWQAVAAHSGSICVTEIRRSGHSGRRNVRVPCWMHAAGCRASLVSVQVSDLKQRLRSRSQIHSSHARCHHWEDACATQLLHFSCVRRSTAPSQQHRAYTMPRALEAASTSPSLRSCYLLRGCGRCRRRPL